MAELSNIAKAICNVMKAVKGIEKNLNVGFGNSSYKGVSDQDVKKTIGDKMQENGLVILPISIDPKIRFDRWEENYKDTIKQKQQVFTEIKTKYLLLHESGESIEIEGYGHGVDSQDKSAGKATTYALKYALLYSFLVPTGKIDDADNNHSEGYEAPKSNPNPPINIAPQTPKNVISAPLTEKEKSIIKARVIGFTKKEEFKDYGLTNEGIRAKADKEIYDFMMEEFNVKFGGVNA